MTSTVPETMTTAARAVDAMKVYGQGDTEVRALDGVTVDFPRSVFTAIMGPSGSGKSTLLHCIAGLDRLTPSDLARFTALNDAYRERFGFPFVIRVAGRSVADILDAYDARLANDADAERATAIEEIAGIMRLRIEAA